MSHPLQSSEWGNFRAQTGVKTVKKDGIQLTIHKVPNTPWKIGYYPKGEMPTKELITTLRQIGTEEKCIFIQLEPDVIYKIYRPKTETAEENPTVEKNWYEKLGLVKSAHPLFTKYTFVLDISKPEEELLKNMHAKTRYNIRVAQKNNVEIVEDNSDEAFKAYLHLTHATTERQKFYAHTDKYHKTQWEMLPHVKTDGKLSSHLLLAKYSGKILAAWIVFVYKDTLYYPYGASSSEHREVMTSNLMMWEAIRFGKGLDLQKFDMWGALGPYPDTKDAWFGFHRFKQGYGGDLIEFVGSYDLVIDPFLYQAYKLADKARWLYLRMRK